MDSLIKNLLVYTDGLNIAKTGTVELSEEICEISLGMKDSKFEGNPKKFFKYSETNPEKSAFMCNYLCKIIQEFTLIKDIKENKRNKEKLKSLYIIFIEEFLKKKNNFELNIDCDAVYLTNMIEIVKNLSNSLPYDFLEEETMIEIWRYFFNMMQVSKKQVYQLKICMNLMRDFFKKSLVKISREKDYEYLKNFIQPILMDLYSLLESNIEAESLEGSDLLLHFSLDIIKFSLKSFLLEPKTQDKKREIVKNELDQFMLEGLLYILTEINIQHKGYVLINSATFELLKVYIMFVCKENEKIFKAEISTLIGILLNNKLESVEKRLDLARELNTKEKIQVKILFDFLNFLISNQSFLELLYYYNDFTEIRRPIVENILEKAFKIFQKIQNSEEGDQSFKKYMKNFISGSILSFMDKKNESKNINPEIMGEIKQILAFKSQLKLIRTLIEEKPKKVLKKFSELYQTEPKEKILENLSLFLQECPLISEGNVTACLGQEPEEYKELRFAFFKVLNFKNLDLLPCLRRLFWCFFMQGETQVIERILNDFSVAYYEQNKDVTSMDSNTIFGYTFSLIFLNTDLHKPQMTKKMSVEEFIRSVTSVVGKDKKPSDEHISEIYESIKNDEIKALKSLDMIKEDHIFLELWDFIHEKLNKRIEILEIILPENLKKIFENRREELKLFMSESLTGKINQIVQNNIWSLVKNNTGNFQIVEELFDSLIQSLDSIHDEHKLQKLTENFLKEINFEKNKEMICYDKNLAWGVFSFALFFVRAFKHASNDFQIFLKTFFECHRFFSSVLKDKYLIDSIKSFSKVRKASKYINTSRTKKTSFLDVFSGFLNKESESGEEEIKLTASSSTSLRIEKMLAGNQDLMFQILDQVKDLEPIDADNLLSYLEKELAFFEVRPRTMHLFACVVNFYSDAFLLREDLISNRWTRFNSFMNTVKSENFDEKIFFDVEKGDQNENENSEDDKKISVKLGEKQLKKIEKYLKNYCLYKLIEVQFLCLEHSDNLPSYQKDLESSLKIFENTSVELLTESLNNLNTSINLLKLNSLEKVENILFIFKKILDITEEKNFENEKTLELCDPFFDSIECYFEKIGSEIPREILDKVSKISLDFLTFLVNSKVNIKSKHDGKIFEIYYRFVKPLNRRIKEISEEKEFKNGFLLEIVEYFFNFLLMTQNPNYELSIKILNFLIPQLVFDILKKEEGKKLLNYIENVFNLNKTNDRGKEGVLEFYKMYVMIFNNSIHLFTGMKLENWCLLVKISAERFIQAFELRDENLAKYVLESLKNSLNLLRSSDEFCDDEGNIKDEVKQESVKAGNEISTEFEQALMKLF